MWHCFINELTDRLLSNKTNSLKCNLKKKNRQCIPWDYIAVCGCVSTGQRLNEAMQKFDDTVLNIMIIISVLQPQMCPIVSCVLAPPSGQISDLLTGEHRHTQGPQVDLKLQHIHIALPTFFVIVREVEEVKTVSNQHSSRPR